jgi:hypothetical protein
VGREHREGLLLVAAGGFHGDQLGPMPSTVLGKTF